MSPQYRNRKTYYDLASARLRNPCMYIHPPYIRMPGSHCTPSSRSLPELLAQNKFYAHVCFILRSFFSPPPRCMVLSILILARRFDVHPPVDEELVCWAQPPTQHQRHSSSEASHSIFLLPLIALIIELLLNGVKNIHRGRGCMKLMSLFSTKLI